MRPAAALRAPRWVPFPDLEISMLNEGDLLWTPSAARVEKANLTAYQLWLQKEKGLKFATYEDLWRWSVSDLEAFWQSLWEYFKVESAAPHERVLESHRMPGTQWFPGARLNYAQHALRYE